MNEAFGPFLVILVGLLSGFLFRRSGRFPAETPRILNAYVIAIALPAVVLSQLPTFLRSLATSESGIDASIAFLPLIPWLIFFGAAAFFGCLYRMGWIRRDQWALLALAGGLGNTSFVGIPLIEALLGREAIPQAILLDQLGTFLALSVAGTIWVAFFREGPRPTTKKVVGDLLRFPPFVALLGAFAVAAIGEWPALVQGALERIGSTLVPVAMVSVGAQLTPNLRTFRAEGKSLFYGLGFKMLIAPCAIAVLAAAMGMRGTSRDVAILEAAMAPMITATVLGIEAGFAPNLGALMLGVGIPLSLVTVPLMHRWLN
jgi:predicted permease